MVVLEQCRIDDKGKNLIIEATIENLSYCENVYIDSIVIDTNNTYNPNCPSNNPVFTKSFRSGSISDDTGSKVKSGSLSTDDTMQNPLDPPSLDTPIARNKRVRLCLTAKDLNLSSFNDNIFFVYVITTGVPDPHIPCELDKYFTMGVAVNLRPIYNMAMRYVKELDSTCNIPKGFIDMILRLKAFDLSLRTGNYQVAFKQWDTLFKNKINIPVNKGCGCNGTT